MLGLIKKEQPPESDDVLKALIKQTFNEAQPSPTKGGGHSLKIPVESPAQIPAAPSPAAAATGQPRELTEAEKLADQLRQGKGIDWLGSKQEEKERFLKMIVEAGDKSALMRSLLQEIAGEPNKLRYISAALHPVRTGQHLVDSFANDTINLGDLDFFPETPGAQTPWEMTRGEQIMHVLAERRALAKDPEVSDSKFQFNAQLRQAKVRRFAQYHAAATEQHNAYRVEQGQPRQIKESEDQNPRRAVLEYEGGRKQVLELDEKGRPSKKSF